MEIRGDWDTKQVWIGGREVRPERSLRVRNHSPDGFSWGDGGSGPAQLALALLLGNHHGGDGTPVVPRRPVAHRGTAGAG